MLQLSATVRSCLPSARRLACEVLRLHRSDRQPEFPTTLSTKVHTSPEERRSKAGAKGRCHPSEKIRLWNDRLSQAETE